MGQTFDYSDQHKIFNTDTWGWPVHLIGAGGINNLIGPTLAKSTFGMTTSWKFVIAPQRSLTVIKWLANLK